MTFVRKPGGRGAFRPRLRGALAQREGVGYRFVNAEAAALVARFTTQPTTLRKMQIDVLVGALKTAGVWSKLDCLYLEAAHDAQAARQNWIQDLYNLTTVSSPTFTVDRGYAGNGSTSYLKTGFIPSTAGGKFTLNDASFGFWSRTDVDNVAADIGARTDGTTALTYIQGRTTGSASYRMNQNAATTFATIANSLGLTAARRSAADAKALFKNGAFVQTSTDASTALAAVEMYIGGLNSGGSMIVPSPRQYAMDFIGGSLSDAEMLSLYDAVNTYLQAVGAA